jgi:hypothetical protein
VTRNRKIDPEVLEREYIFDAATPPISFSGLAEKYGLARNTVAEKGVKGRWFERRKEFREQLGMKVTEALGDQWVRYETAVREKMMSGFVVYIEKWVAAVDAGEIKVSTRDMLGVAAALRTFMADALAAKPSEEVLLDPDTSDIGPDEYRRALAAIEQIESGGADDAEAAAPAGAPGAGED